MLKNKRIALSRSQMIAVGFFVIIMLGTLLLMTPIATRDGQNTNFLNAMFTATSATCVTGLITYDTYTHWTVFGQIVILLMIQIGGLGFITFGVFGMTLLRKKIGLKNRELIHDSLNSMHVGGGVVLVKNIIKGTALIEGVGAILLSIRFIPQMGVLKGLYFAVFHSISAFCNAGFDLMGSVSGEYSSLCNYSNDVLVNIVIMALIIIGGLGFLVWNDIYINKLNFKKYMLHTKIVLAVSFVLLFGGMFFFMFSERNGILLNMNIKEKILACAFSSVTTRTAGFNTVDLTLVSDIGKFVMMILMFIGGSPGSTAGGIKTTTVAAIFFFIVSYIKKRKGYFAFKRCLEDDIIKKASTVFFINISLVVVSIAVITLNQQLEFIDVAFETFSAIGTVGMSTGITREFTSISKIVIMILMYCGRVGSLSFALSFTDGKKIPDIKYPTEEITIG